MSKRRKRDQPRLDDTMGQGVGAEPQPSNMLPEAVVGQTEQPGEGLEQPDESGAGSGLGIGKVQDGQPMGGSTPEHSGQQSGRARNGRGAARESREAMVDRDTEPIVDRDTEIRRETDFRDATGHPLDPDAGGKKVTREDDIFLKEEES